MLDTRIEGEECLLYDNDRNEESGEQKWSNSRRSTTCLSIPSARLQNQAGDWTVRALSLRTHVVEETPRAE
jgi:hypothetical protein